MTLKKALEKIDASVEAYRVLLRDNPADTVESAERQQAAADLLDEAQTLGVALNEKDQTQFFERFSEANREIENLETKRLSGGDDEDDPDGEDEDFPEAESPEPEDDKAELYSSMVEPEDEED